jgi:predicted RNA-binding Zn-ribbon protein involved in translation (DUF1610 family)
MRRHREGRSGRVAARDDAPGTASEPTGTTHSQPSAQAQSAAIARRRREAGRSQDQAVYTCQCGFVFEALVSTSVDCPNCGDAQAW